MTGITTPGLRPWPSLAEAQADFTFAQLWQLATEKLHAHQSAGGPIAESTHATTNSVPWSAMSSQERAAYNQGYAQAEADFAPSATLPMKEFADLLNWAEKAYSMLPTTKQFNRTVIERAREAMRQAGVARGANGQWQCRDCGGQHPNTQAVCTYGTADRTAVCKATPYSYGGGASCDQKWDCEECGDVTDTHHCPLNRTSSTRSSNG